MGSLNWNGDKGEIGLLRTGKLLRWRRDAAEGGMRWDAGMRFISCGREWGQGGDWSPSDGNAIKMAPRCG